MSKILTPYTNPSDISLGADITSTQLNTVKNTQGNWVSANTPTTPCVVVTGATTLSLNNQDVYAGGTAAYTITLPPIPAGDTNVFFQIIKTSDNKNGSTPLWITIAAAGGNTINGAATKVLYTKGHSVFLNCNATQIGTDWEIVSETFPTKDLMFSAYQTSNQTIGTSATKINLQAELFDFNGDFDTTTYRYTPQVPGYYRVSGGIALTSGSNSDATVWVYKNGSSFKRGNQNANMVSGETYLLTVSCLVPMNGTTDYLEFYSISAAASSTSAGVQDLTYFDGNIVNPL